MKRKTFVKRENLERKIVKVIEKTAETKNFSAFLSNQSVGTTQVLNHLTGVPSGTNESTRIGNKWRPQGLAFRYCIKQNNATAAPICIRIMIVRARRVDALGITDLPLINATSDYTRIFVLYDKMHTVSGANSTGPNVITRKGFIQKKRLLQMESDVGSTTNIKNSCYLMHVSDNNVLTPSITWLTNLTFIDT